MWFENYSMFCKALGILSIAKPVLMSKQPGGGLISAKQAIEMAWGWEWQQQQQEVLVF